jgi:uroporphyrinogen-III synthase
MRKVKRVLVTRPEKSAVLLARRLEARGHEVFIEPLLAIQATGCEKPSGSSDVVMLTSANALAPFTNNKEVLRDLFLRPCFCVGAQTASVAAEMGFGRLEHGGSDGEALAGLMQKKLQAGQNILHLCEENTLSRGAQLLLSYGFSVVSWPTYRALGAQSFSPRLKTYLTQKKLDSALFFSPRSASLFVKLAQAGGFDGSGLEAVALSEAVASKLGALKWRVLRIAERPSTEAVLDCLEVE